MARRVKNRSVLGQLFDVLLGPGSARAEARRRHKPNVRRAAQAPPAAARRNPTAPKGERAQLAAARQLARKFHGRGAGDVVKLSKRERLPGEPAYAAVVGAVKAIEYEVNDRSKRAGLPWRHESGDRGPGRPRARNRPLEVAFPGSLKTRVVNGKSPMKLSPTRGLMG